MNATEEFPGIADQLRRHAERRPDACAIASRHHQLSYAELAQAVQIRAGQLRADGIGSDACVALEIADPVAHLVACLALVQLGAASCALPPGRSPGQQQALMHSCGVTHRLGPDHHPVSLNASTGDATPTVDRAPVARLLMATSGTSGTPKIVVLHSSDLVAQAPRHVGDAGERFACLAAIEHNFVKRHRLYCVAQGATNVFLEPAGAPVADQCRALQVTVLHLTAFQAQELLATSGDGALAGVRLKLGGSHVAPALRRDLQSRLSPALHCGYGTTETGAIAFSDPQDREAGDSVGRPLPGITLRILDDAGQPLPEDRSGEIAVRCAGMFRGYLGQAERTAACLKDGWFHTGDIGRLDAQGRLTVCGRADDMFVFNSMNICPQDIESVICRFPGVRDAAVVPKPSPVHGQIPVALVQWADPDGQDLPALKRFVREQAGLRCPRHYHVVERIPRNAAGKIARAEAAAQLTGTLP